MPPRARLFAAVSALLLLAACASVPPPTDLMARAQQQLDIAQKAQASDYAPVDLGFAKQRFQSAQAAMSAKKYSLAQDLAQESLADGRLAQIRAELAVLRKKIRQQSAQNARLRAQFQNGGAPASGSSTGLGPDNSGLPAEVTLPQATLPAPADSAAPAPAPARPSSAGGSQ